MKTTFIKLSAVAIAFSMSVGIPAAYSDGKAKVKKSVSRTSMQKRNMAVRPANFRMVSNSSPRRKEIFLQDCRKRKTRMNHYHEALSRGVKN